MFNPALIAPVFVCAHLSIGAPVEWLAPVSGSWEDGMNWSGGIAPGSAVDDVYLLHETAYDVTINQAQLSRSLQITNPQAGLQIADGASLTLFGGIENNGTIIINPSSGQNGASVQAILDAEINGSGVLRLNGQQRGHARLNGSGIELTHGADHTIEGSGWLNASRIANMGTIATRPDQPSALWLQGEIIQSGDGTVVSSGQPIIFRGESVVEGGVMRAENGGWFQSRADSLTLRDVELIGSIDLELETQRQFWLAGTVTHHGELTTSLSGFGGDMLIASGEDTLLTGDCTIRFDCNHPPFSTGCRILVTQQSTLTFDSSVTLEGRGTVQISDGSRLINNGRIVSNIPGEAMAITGHIQGNGELIADGSEIYIADVCEGQTITLIGSPELLTGSGSLLRDVRFTTDYTYRGTGASLRLGGTIETDHDMVMFFGNGLYIEEDCSLVGNGQLFFASNIRVAADKTLVIDEDFTVIGGGRVTTFGDESRIILRGTLQGPSSLETAIEGDGGRIIASILDTELEHVNLNNVELASGEEGAFYIYNTLLPTTLTDIHVSGELLLHRVQEFIGNLRIDGAVRVDHDSAIEIMSGGAIDGSGVIELISEPDELARLESMEIDGRTSVNGVTVSGDGILTGPIDFGGTLEVGGESGLMRLDGTALTEDARVVLDIAQDINPNVHDRILIEPQSSVHLAGTLELVANPDLLKAGMRWEILTGAGIEGDFDRFVFPDAPNGSSFLTEQENDWYGVVLTCTGDLNRDFRLNFHDVSRFIAGFIGEAWYADLNQDQRWDFFDVTAFLKAYSDGCYID
jgi:uncharacterized Zn-binding protein involved in type VI secretion